MAATRRPRWANRKFGPRSRPERLWKARRVEQGSPGFPGQSGDGAVSWHAWGRSFFQTGHVHFYSTANVDLGFREVARGEDRVVQPGHETGRPGGMERLPAPARIKRRVKVIEQGHGTTFGHPGLPDCITSRFPVPSMETQSYFLPWRNRHTFTTTTRADRSHSTRYITTSPDRPAPQWWCIVSRWPPPDDPTLPR